MGSNCTTRILALASLHLHTLVINDDNLDLGNPVTDDGVRCLSRCRELALLTVRSPAVTDAALESLGKIKTLKVLDLKAAPVTGVGLHHLEDMPALSHWTWAAPRSATTRSTRSCGSRASEYSALASRASRPPAATGSAQLLPKTFVLGPRTVPVRDLEVPPEAAPYLINPYYP